MRYSAKDTAEKTRNSKKTKFLVALAFDELLIDYFSIQMSHSMW